MKQTNLFFIIGLFFATSTVKSQIFSDSISYTKKTRPRFTTLAAGASFLKSRDFATSPLFYRGTGTNLSIGRLALDSNREIALSASFFSGSNHAVVGGSVDPTIVETNTSFQLVYTRLYKINLLSNNKWNTKIGVDFVGDFQTRINESLFNNAIGLESQFNIMPSIKVTYDLSRYVSKDFHFLFINKKLKPIRRELSVKQSIGLINMYVRPDYAYSSLEEIHGEQNMTNFRSSVSSSNSFRWKSDVAYTKYYSNGNGLKLGYSWDVFVLPGKFNEPFESSRHTISLALLFKTR